MEFPKNRKLNVFSKTAVAAIVAGIMLFPYNTYAASWLDTNNYDICKNLYLNCAAQNLVKFRLYRCCKTNKTSV